MSQSSKPQKQLEGARVLITKGEYIGREGVCLGPVDKPGMFAISPTDSVEIINLRFEEEFSLLMDLSTDAHNN